MHTSALSFSRRSASGATCSFHVHAAAGGTGRDQSGIRPRSPIAVGERALLPDLSVARDRVAQYSSCRRQLSQLAAVQCLSRSEYPGHAIEHQLLNIGNAALHKSVANRFSNAIAFCNAITPRKSTPASLLQNRSFAQLLDIDRLRNYSMTPLSRNSRFRILRYGPRSS